MVYFRLHFFLTPYTSFFFSLSLHLIWVPTLLSTHISTDTEKNKFLGRIGPPLKKPPSNSAGTFINLPPRNGFTRFMARCDISCIFFSFVYHSLSSCVTICVHPCPFRFLLLAFCTVCRRGDLSPGSRRLCTR